MGIQFLANFFSKKSKKSKILDLGGQIFLTLQKYGKWDIYMPSFRYVTKILMPTGYRPKYPFFPLFAKADFRFSILKNSTNIFQNFFFHFSNSPYIGVLSSNFHPNRTWEGNFTLIFYGLGLY